MSVLLRGTTVVILAIACNTVAAQSCRPGTREYSREQLAPNRIRIYCVCNADVSAMRQADDSIRELQTKIEANRSAIHSWQRDVPHFMVSLDEWVEMDGRARAETRARAVDAVLSTSLNFLRVHARQNSQATQAEMQTLWQEFNSTPLGSPRFHEILREQRAGAAKIRRWQSYSDFAETANALQDVIGALDSGQRAEYGRALINVLAIGLRDPRLAALVAEIDFATTAVLGNVTAQVARVRMQQFLDLGGERLRALSALARTYRDNVDKLKQERAKRELILQRAGNPNASCPA